MLGFDYMDREQHLQFDSKKNRNIQDKQWCTAYSIYWSTHIHCYHYIDPM